MYQHKEIKYMQHYVEVHKLDAEIKTWFDTYTTVQTTAVCAA